MIQDYIWFISTFEEISHEKLIVSSYKNKNFICFSSFSDTSNSSFSFYFMLKLDCNDK